MVERRLPGRLDQAVHAAKAAADRTCDALAPRLQRLAPRGGQFHPAFQPQRQHRQFEIPRKSTGRVATKIRAPAGMPITMPTPLQPPRPSRSAQMPRYPPACLPPAGPRDHVVPHAATQTGEAALTVDRDCSFWHARRHCAMQGRRCQFLVSNRASVSDCLLNFLASDL